MSIGHLYVLFGELSIQVLCPFFNWIVCFLGVQFVSSLWILDNNPLSDVSMNIFSHSVGCLFILLMITFAMKNFLVWCSLICLFFFFCFPCLGDTSYKIWLWAMSEILLPMFSSRFFVVSGLTFKEDTNF